MKLYIGCGVQGYQVELFAIKPVKWDTDGCWLDHGGALIARDDLQDILIKGGIKTKLPKPNSKRIAILEILPFKK